jgi:hypothetical protein
MHGDAENIGGHSRNRIQVFDWIIERPALEQGLVDVRLRPAKQDRVAVRLSACDSGGTNEPTANERFARPLCQPGGLSLIKRMLPSVIGTPRLAAN